MRKPTKTTYTISLIIISGRLVFIFSNAIHQKFLSNPGSFNTGSITTGTNEQEAQTQYLVSPSNNEISPGSNEDLLIQKVQGNQNLREDIKILETLRTKNNDPKILKTLIEKLAQNYEFEKADSYLQTLLSGDVSNENTSIEMFHQNISIDPTLHLYIMLNDPSFISITDENSIQKLLPIMNRYKTQGLLSIDDYDFYQGLIKIWHKDYEGAKKILNSITAPRYQSTIQSLKKAIISYNESMKIPKYYQDGLVALSLLKNGYFSLAKRLALDTVLKDSKYILPYQILAYTHFLTNNREIATEYFLKLADFDETNKDLYKFLIGISYYRGQKYEQSILYLTQVNTVNLQSDTWRYLILNYVEEGDTSNAAAVRQKLLGQNDINPSDYYNYFYQAFYAPYLTKQEAKIYKENTLLADMYLNSCDNNLSGSDADICSYGKIGMTLIKSPHSLNSQTNSGGIAEVMRLANKYHTSYLFEVLGDLAMLNKDNKQAEQDYIKALSLTQDAKEQKSLQEKISKISSNN